MVFEKKGKPGRGCTKHRNSSILLHANVSGRGNQSTQPTNFMHFCCCCCKRRIIRIKENISFLKSIAICAT